MSLSLRIISCFCVIALFASSASAGDKLKATSGVQQVEGAGGGGLVPWATIAGSAQYDQTATSVFASYVSLDDFDFVSVGASVGLSNRVEVSIAQQFLDIATLGLQEQELQQTVYGVKLKLLGDFVYDFLPQVAIGAQYKVNNRAEIPLAVGAAAKSDTEIYVAVSRYFLAKYPVIVNGTLRRSRANQLGLLGFGGDGRNDYAWLFEGSMALQLSRDVLVGVEFREKPDNLTFTDESHWRDAFIGWIPTKTFSLALAYVDAGSIASRESQDGIYFSAQVNF